MKQKKDIKTQEIFNLNTFKPKIEKASANLAQQRKAKVAQSIGMDAEKLQEQIDRNEFLRI